MCNCGHGPVLRVFAVCAGIAAFTSVKIRVSCHITKLICHFRGMVQHQAHHFDQTLLLLMFILWGYIKSKLFSSSVSDIETLKARITDALSVTAKEMLENAWQEFNIT